MPGIRRGHGKRQKSRNFSASKWTKKLESLTKTQPKTQPQKSFKIISICIITGFKPPYDNVLGFVLIQSIALWSEHLPKSLSQEPGRLMHVPNFLLRPHSKVAQIFGGAREKGMALRQQLHLEGFWCLLLQCSLMQSMGWQWVSSRFAVVISWLQHVSICLPASTRYNQVR